MVLKIDFHAKTQSGKTKTQGFAPPVIMFAPFA
jgi:hypothetical protein